MWSNGITDFEIQLDNHTATYGPGDTIIGKLILVLSCRKRLRALKLRFQGECKVSWSESRGSGSDSETDWYDGTEKYFHSDICLVGTADGDTIEMRAGHYVYPFSYKLPRNIPGSYKHPIGNINYSVIGIFDRAWRIDDRVKKIFTVDAPLEWEPLEYRSMNGIDDEIVKSLCCCIFPCMTVGRVLLRIRIPCTTFGCGDRITATINVNNESNIVVTKIKLKLEETLDFHSTSPTKTKRDINTIQKVKELGPFTRNTAVNFNLRVPELPFSFFKYCKLIERNYRLNVSLHYSGSHCATKRTYGVAIGSRTAMPILSCQPYVPVMEKYPPDRESSSQVPSGSMSSPKPPSVFSGSFPARNLYQSRDEGFVRAHQSFDRMNSNNSPPPLYDITVGKN